MNILWWRIVNRSKHEEWHAEYRRLQGIVVRQSSEIESLKTHYDRFATRVNHYQAHYSELRLVVEKAAKLVGEFYHI